MAARDLDDMAALLGDPKVMRYYPRPKSRDDTRPTVVASWIAHPKA
jgi:hypothetical protein